MFLKSSRRIELKDGKDTTIIIPNKIKEYPDNLKTLDYFQACLKDGIIKYEKDPDQSIVEEIKEEKKIKKEVKDDSTEV